MLCKACRTGFFSVSKQDLNGSVPVFIRDAPDIRPDNPAFFISGIWQDRYRILQPDIRSDLIMSMGTATDTVRIYLLFDPNPV